MTVKGYIIREAETHDASAIASLITQPGYPVSTEEMAGRVKILFSMPQYMTFVAEAGGDVVGLVGAYMGHSWSSQGCMEGCGKHTFREEAALRLMTVQRGCEMPSENTRLSLSRRTQHLRHLGLPGFFSLMSMH